MVSSSSRARISSSLRMTVPFPPAERLFLPPKPTRRVWILTVSRLVPMEEIDSVTDAVVPWPIATSTVTLMTPMMTPSIVRKERALLPQIALKAMVIVCSR